MSTEKQRRLGRGGHGADHPVDECPHMIGFLDKRLGGVSIEELAAEQGQPVPSAS